MARNIILDYFKVFLSILVVLLHIQPLFEGWDSLSLLGWEISNGLSRIAVPCFFILNGYFISTKIGEWSQVKKYVKKLFIIYIVWLLIYLSFNASLGWISISHDSLNLLLLKVLLGYSHLWYVVALIEAVLILYLINQVDFFRGMFIQISSILILIVLGYIIQSFFVKIFGVGYYYYRNAIFIALPFIWMGIIIKRQYHQLQNVNKIILLILLVLALVCLFLESYFSYILDLRMDIYISLIIVCPSLFLLVINYSIARIRHSENYDGFFGGLSSSIYYTHLMGITCIFFLPAEINMFLKLPLIMFVILMISFLIVYINKKIKIFL